ncbi:hypothetical protein GD627_05790 [Arthrobacter yangruifuii]|uniref:Uncharacterized protein n=1 Tax=Arthrobacter yangruifuii TaxID=2606616 RepID=A0A5N6MTI5_9MICC|nr:hypothetical protein [Arthrobacter yangruifuii]KAD4060539.1 hypothetical protein GD627_05790 [Arthrobacter yangruifuii]
MNRSSRKQDYTQITGWAALAVAAAGWWYGLLRQIRTALTPADPERGDVPGWVMITLMSAILVAGLLALVQPALKDLFESAIKQVKP